MRKYKIKFFLFLFIENFSFNVQLSAAQAHAQQETTSEGSEQALSELRASLAEHTSRLQQCEVDLKHSNEQVEQLNAKVYSDIPERPLMGGEL